jgi:hypothetical protein
MSLRFFFLLIVILPVVGCANKQVVVVPVGIPMAPGMVNEFMGGSPLEIVNAQPDNNEYIIHRGAYSDLYGVMHDWTEAVIAQLQKELNQRGINIVPQANKKLSLCVENAKILFGSQVGGGLVYSSLKLKVENGDGYVSVFEGNHSADSLDLAVGGAVTSAVAALLRDSSLLEYITK